MSKTFGSYFKKRQKLYPISINNPRKPAFEKIKNAQHNVLYSFMQVKKRYCKTSRRCCLSHTIVVGRSKYTTCWVFGVTQRCGRRTDVWHDWNENHSFPQFAKASWVKYIITKSIINICQEHCWWKTESTIKSSRTSNKLTLFYWNL